MLGRNGATARMLMVTVAIAAMLSARLRGMPPSGQSLELCDAWRFAKGEQVDAQAVDFDDKFWKVVRVPHDWAIAGPFDPNENGYAGKLPWRGIGWYRNSFTLDREPGDRVYLDFDGVMAFPQVFVNGKLAGEWDYGYTSFRIDATPYVNLKGNNVVAVRVDTTKHQTRWYPGAGIYRKVTLQVCKPGHFAQWGVQVTTPIITEDSATANVVATIENHGDQPVEATVEFVVCGPDGHTCATPTTRQLTLRPGSNAIEQNIEITSPQRWDVDSPNLYVLRAEIDQGDVALDTQTTPFGIRSCEFTANDGFHLNGRRLQIHGVNLHHDQGALGAAFNRRAMQRQLEIMHDMGVNAIRTSHNPPAPELLDLCDRMGIVVWEECFDKWNGTADRVDGQPSHEEHAERHLRSMVSRDRNHPSVVAWSIGNEIPAGGDGVTAERVKMMRDVVRNHDPTRPVGMGCDNPEQAATHILDALDMTGWNYGRRYARYRETHPDKPIVYSESASAFSTRGFYELPLPKNKTDYSEQYEVDSYDFNSASWADIPDTEFKLLRDDKFMAGEFVWTGFDYLGEPSPFEQKAKSSYFGIVDLCGFPKDRYYLYRSYWRPDALTVHILPHWNWPDRVGKVVPVFVYTNGDSAELFLNGKSLGRRTKGVIPKNPIDFAAGRPASASADQSDTPAEAAVDVDEHTRWSAPTPDSGQWWQVDLGEVRPLKYLMLEFEREAKHYGYEIKVSDDLTNWTTVIEQRPSNKPAWGGPNAAMHDVDAHGRYVRIEFTDLRANCWASLRDFQVYPERAEYHYYAPTYDYRLRWNDVIYEPGELKAVAYRGEQEIGTAIVRTAGEPTTIRLTPDRSQLAATGEDLCYVTVEALDRDGCVCPLANNLIHFQVDGPGEIAAVDNGDPLSLEPFQSNQRTLFFGKAILIVRPKKGPDGDMRVTATSDKLTEATISCRSASP